MLVNNQNTQAGAPSLAMDTVENFLARATRLYEQEQKAPEGPSALGLCVRRWMRWADGGL
jgi:hypothetical protein